MMAEQKIPEDLPDAAGTRHRRRWVLSAILIAVGFLAIHWWQTRDLASGVAPPVEARLVTGERVSLKDYLGRPLLLHFWADWCPVCRAENDSIASLSGDYPVLGVAMHSGDAAAVLEFLRTEGLSFSTIADPQGRIADDWHVTAVPTSFVIDAQGRIRFSVVGYTTEAGLRARLWAARRL
jgi:peroxiredoxin